MRPRAIAPLLCAALLLAGADRALADPSGGVRGRVALGVEGLPLAAVAPVVVYLEALDGTAPGGAPGAAASMRQRDARFSPSFLVVVAGQSLEMANDDAIYHNVFSYSRPNDFDLGLYPAGETRTLVLRHAGVVKMYCSIHESMNATILVVPTRWFATVGASGSYALSGVRPGRYRAVVWAERLPVTTRVIEIAAGQTKAVDWVIGSAGQSSESTLNDAPRTRVASSAGSAAAIRKP
jgi:plastocyanin